MIAPVPDRPAYQPSGATFDYTAPDDMVTVRVKTYTGERTFTMVDVEWLSDGREGADAHSQTIDPYKLRDWQVLLEVLTVSRPGIAWARILEPAKVATAPGLPPLTHIGNTRRLLTIDDLENRPAAVWGLEDVWTEGSLVVVYGPSGCGKTFAVLGMLLSVASNTPWMGRKVRGGPVLYVPTEGMAGLKQRIRAWRDKHPAADVSDFYWTDEPLNMLNEQHVTSLLQLIDEMPMPPALVVIDTLARSMIGGDENAARDMGIFIAAADRIRAATGGTVLIVHHTGKSGDLERGSSALRGAADTMIAVSKDESVVKLACAKQKDAPEFSPIYATLVEVEDSCILAPMSLAVETGLTAKAKQVLRELTATFPATGATPAQMIRVSGLPERTVYRALKALEERGLARTEGTGRAIRYIPVGDDDCQTAK